LHGISSLLDLVTAMRADLEKNITKTYNTFVCMFAVWIFQKYFGVNLDQLDWFFQKTVNYRLLWNEKNIHLVSPDFAFKKIGRT
jgi:hypothetical protein